MHAEECPLPDLTVNAAGKQQADRQNCRTHHWRRQCQANARPSRHWRCSPSVRLAADEPGLADRGSSLFLPDQPAERQCRIDIAAGREIDDRQLAAAKRLERALSAAPGVPARIVPSAEIHSGQVGSQPGPLLRTTTKRIGGRVFIEGCAAHGRPQQEHERPEAQRQRRPMQSNLEKPFAIRWRSLFPAILAGEKCQIQDA